MEKIQFYSPKTKKFYQLFPTKTIPTLKISGVPMHRFVKLDPLEDTLSKIIAVKPFGIVLDSCCGLGYTAIYSAKEKKVKQVYTFEKDKEVIKIAKLNPASKELFSNKKIKLKIADTTKEIKKFNNEFFDCIIHDPPTFKMSPELYSEEFYKELFRVLKNKGRLWHYCPKPGKLKGKSHSFQKLIEKKLKNCGFKKVYYEEKSQGIIAIK